MSCRSWLSFFVIALIVGSFPALGQENTSAPSLADVARKLRKDTTDEVRMTDADTKKLFESVDRIFAFSAADSGMPKRAAVKRRLVSKADVEAYARQSLAKEEFTQRFAQAELSMKKLGFLPRDFNLKEFLVKSTGQQIAAYYDDETKTVSMLNWVPPDRQEPILAHELTHALQDQNYDLRKWMKAAQKPASSAASADSKANQNDDDDGAIARKAVVEGQAMVVYVDYLLAPLKRNLAETPELLYSMEEPAVKAVQDSQMLHDAPMIMREMGTFAYNEGLIFEGELLHKGGRSMAFAGAFAHPPRSSHEVLQPQAYISRENRPATGVPDLKQLLGEQYEVYDSGKIGQLDVRAYLKQYGERKIADDLSSAWQGGAYVTYRRSKNDGTDKAAGDVPPTTADLALLHVSRWKTPQAAERFARFYAGAVALRYRTATAQPAAVCSGTNCPVSSEQILTEEGPVIIEHWADNSVIISESFDTTTAVKARGAIRDGVATVHAADSPQEEIGLRLYEIPAFQKFAEQIGMQIAQAMASTPSH
jgi:hypothetical protein